MKKATRIIAVVLVLIASFAAFASAQDVQPRADNVLVTGELRTGKGQPMRMDQYPYPYLTLVKRAGKTNEFAAGTNCQDGQGCVNDASAKFWFTKGVFFTPQGPGEAPLAPGKYLFVINFPGLSYGDGYWLSGESEGRVIEVDLSPGVNNLGALVPTPAKVRLEIQQSKMSNPNGGLNVQVKVYNVSTGLADIEVKGFFSAVGASATYAYYPVLPVRVTIKAGETKVLDFFLPGSMGAVNGTSVGGLFQAVELSDPLHVIGEVLFNIAKY